MNINHLFVPLGVDSTPIGQRKQIHPFLGAALVSAGAGFLGNLLGNNSQRQANESNLQATRETNQMNYQIASEANRMSNEQFYKNLNWLKSQYYDTDQYARLRESLSKGGLNPALAYGSANPVGSVGQASPTSFHAAQMEAGHVDPLSYDGLSESVGSAANAYFQNQLISNQAENVNADTQTKRINNMTQFAKNLAELHNLWEDIENKRSQRGLSDSQKKYYDDLSDEIRGKIRLFMDTYNDLKEREKKSNRLLDSQANEVDSRTALNEIEVKYKPMLLKAGIKLSQSQSEQLLSSAAALMEEAKNSYHYRHEVMPLEVIQKKLANSISEIVFKQDKSYEDFIKNEDMSDYRNFIKTFGELLFRLAK